MTLQQLGRHAQHHVTDPVSQADNQGRSCCSCTAAAPSISETTLRRLGDNPRLIPKRGILPPPPPPPGRLPTSNRFLCIQDTLTGTQVAALHDELLAQATWPGQDAPQGEGLALGQDQPLLQLQPVGRGPTWFVARPSPTARSRRTSAPSTASTRFAMTPPSVDELLLIGWALSTPPARALIRRFPPSPQAPV